MAAHIYIYDVIGDGWYGGIGPNDVRQALEEIPAGETELSVHFNTPGGICTDGIAIYNLFRQFSKDRRKSNSVFKTIGYVEGSAYSAGSIALMGCDERVGLPGSMIMIHKAWTMSMGNAVALRKEADTLEIHDKQMADIYSLTTGLETEKVMSLLEAETYFTTDEALANKIITRVDEDEEDVTPAAKHAKSKHYGQILSELFHERASKGTQSPDVRKNPRAEAQRKLFESRLKLMEIGA